MFALGQRLALLVNPEPGTSAREYLSGEQFWRDRHPGRPGEGEPERSRSPWRVRRREYFVRTLSAGGGIRRLALVCAAGLGKSTNLAWLEAALAAPGSMQVPFLFRLDRSLPAREEVFWNDTLPDRLRAAGCPLPAARLTPHLARLRRAGRITLLFDSLDQAHGHGRELLHALLAHDGDWRRCPIVVSSRPHAVYDGWDDLILPRESDWHFARVEELLRPEQELLLGPDGVDLAERRRLGAAVYRRLPPGGRALLGNPRNLDYVRACRDRPDGPDAGRCEPTRLDQFTLRDMRTASHLFAGAADHMIRRGMKSATARTLGRRDRERPPGAAEEWQIGYALDLLGALAYAMYRRPAPGKRPRGEPFRPNVSLVRASAMGDFLKDDVLPQLAAAGLLPWPDYDRSDLVADVRALAALNHEIQYDLLDADGVRRSDFRWYNRSLQEFFAAWWLSRYATPDDLARLRVWRYDDTRDETRRSLYAPLWGFLAEMPRAAWWHEDRRRNRGRVWASAVGVLFEPGAPRCCEMMFRAWPALRRSRAGRRVIRGWRDEFRALLAEPGVRGGVARQIPAGFRRCPKNPADDRTPFLMGSPETEAERDGDEFQHEVTVSPFALHEFPVTNAQFELFDPSHADERWGYPAGIETHPAGADADNHPAVNVTWFQAWAFAYWVGHRLPTEAEWEYACRARPGLDVTSPFHFGSVLRGDRANHDGNYPYGTTKDGSYRKITTPRGTFPPNDWGLYDLHGNIWEWCRDYYSGVYYGSSPGRNPRGPSRTSARVLRGGSWLNLGWLCRSAYRGSDAPTSKLHDYGFRLAAVSGAEPCAGKGVSVAEARRRSGAEPEVP